MRFLNMFLSFVSRLFQQPEPQVSFIETLEPRLCLSAAAAMATPHVTTHVVNTEHVTAFIGQSGELDVVGTQYADNIEIKCIGDPVTFQKDIFIVTSSDGLNQTFTGLTNNRLNVEAGNGDDHIKVTGPDMKYQFFFMDVEAGAGNDLVNVIHYDGACFVNGDVGNDVLYAQAAFTGHLQPGPFSQILFNGGAGNDVLIGSSNQDFLYGGSGNDILSGNAGNDILDGGTGHNILKGGAGDDIYNVFPIGGTDPTGSNTGGFDTIIAGNGNDTVQYFYNSVFSDHPIFGTTICGDHITSVTTDFGAPFVG